MKLRELVFEDRLIEFSQKQHFSLSLSIILASSYWNINCLIFKFARIILLPSAILILDKLRRHPSPYFFISTRSRFINRAIIRILGDPVRFSYSDSFDNIASLKRCPQSSLIVPRQRSAHPDPPQFSGGRISSCRVATSKTPQSSSSAPRDISARIISVYWSRGHRRQLHFRFDLFRRFFVHCFFVRCFEKQKSKEIVEIYLGWQLSN